MSSRIKSKLRYLMDKHMELNKAKNAPRGVAQRCGIPHACSWSHVRVVVGTMWGGIYDMQCASHSGSIGVLG